MAEVAGFSTVALRWELAEAILGTLFVAIALTAIGASFIARPRRDPSSFWFGVVALLYGVRLLVRSELIALATGWPDTLFAHVAGFVTYSILVPVGRFVETLVGRGWQQSIRRTWQLTCVYAAAAMLTDIVRGEPQSTMWLNAPVVLLTLVVQVPQVLARVRGSRWSIQARAVMTTLLLFTAVVIYETVAPRGLAGGYDAEPIAMLLFTSALGWFVLTRASEQSLAYAAVSRELDLASDIQRSLLPQRMPDVPGLRIEGIYLPMSAVAGDFYDVTTLSDGRIGVIVADVSGHGVPAALVASMVKLAFAVESERYHRPGEILGGINRALTGKFERAYVTAVCAVIDRIRDRIEYAAAGHPPALLRRAGGHVEPLEERGVALTMFPDAVYGTAEVSFHAGDRLLLFTDGLLEASRKRDGEFFGDAELARIVAGLPDSMRLADHVMRAHRDWIGATASLSDDVTVVVVESVDARATEARHGRTQYRAAPPTRSDRGDGSPRP